MWRKNDKYEVYLVLHKAFTSKIDSRECVEDRVIDNVAVVVLGTRQFLHNVTSRLDIGDTFLCITIIFGTYINIVFNIIITLAILTTITTTFRIFITNKHYGCHGPGQFTLIFIMHCIITVILRIQS